MKQLIFIILLLLAFNVNATSMSEAPSMNVSTSGTRTTVDLVKSGGSHLSPSAVNASVASARARQVAHDNNLANLAKIRSESPVLPKSLGGKVLNLIKDNKAGAVAVVASLVCGFLHCDEMKDEAVQAIKDWLDHGALGIDKDGNPTEDGLVCADGFNSSALCDKWLKEGSGTSGYVAIVTGVYPSSGIVSCQLMNPETGNLGSGGSIGCSGGSATSSPVPVSPVVAGLKLAKTPISDTDFDKILEGLHDVAEKYNDPSIDAEAEDPVVTEVGGWIPDSVGGGGMSGCPPTADTCDPAGGAESGGSVDLGKPESIEITPDRTVIKKKTSVDCAKTGVARVECQKVENTETTMPDGSVQRSSKASAPTAEELGLEKSKKADSPEDYCKGHVDYIACSKYGEVPKPEELKLTDVKIELNATSLGSGSCPNSIPISLSSGSQSMSLQAECDFASKIKPLIIAFAWLAAGFIVIGGVRE